MPGAPDPLYVAARRVLLDALTALNDHRNALVLVGAQAVYVHAGEVGLTVAPFTTDGDLAIDPRQLAPNPRLEIALAEAGFVAAANAVGTWETSVRIEGTLITVALDLLVPESLGGAGRRGARIPPHSTTAARKVSGLEATLVDRDRHTISALDQSDLRQFDLAVAGPAALIVAKVHKILDRIDDLDRRSDKDALDIFRLLRAIPTAGLSARFTLLLAEELSRATTERAIVELPRLFGSPRSPGAQMAVRAAGSAESGDAVAASLVALSNDLIRGVRRE